MGQQHVLDVARIDVEAAANDEVLDAVNDVEVAVVIEVADVAGVQPAVTHRRRGRLRTVPVAGHEHRSADADLAVLAGRQPGPVGSHDSHLHPLDRRAHRAKPAAGGRLGTDQRAGLRTAVALPDLAAGHPPLELGRHLRGQWCRARGDPLQAGQVVRLERLSQQHLDHRRHQRADLHAVLLDQLHEPGRVEPAHQHAAGGLPGVQPGHRDEQAIGVGQRQRQQPAHAIRGVGRGRGGRSGCVQRRVAERHPLGSAGGAAGVQQRGQIGIGAIDQRQLVGLFELLPRHRSVGPDYDHRQPAGRGLHLRQELRCGDAGHRAGVLDHVSDLRLGQQEQDRRWNGAGSPQRGVGKAHLRAIGHAGHHPVAGLHAELPQAAGGPPGPAGQLSAAEPPALEQQALVVAESLEQIVGAAAERDAGNGHGTPWLARGSAELDGCAGVGQHLAAVLDGGG